MLVGKDFATDINATKYDISRSLPMDIANEFKRGRTDTNLYDVSGSVVIPYLMLESLSYRFGIRDNASQTATLRGDSIYYAGASAYVQETVGTNVANQAINFTNAPIAYNGDAIAGTRYALGVSLVTAGKRLVKGVDYTETATAVTILAAVPVAEKVRISYQSAVVANYPQASHAVDSATRPSAIKGKNIEVYVGGNTAGFKWPSVQAVNVEYRVNLDRDEEFGNYYVVSQDYDVPQVSGSIDIKPRDVAELMTRIRQISGVSATNEAVGPYTSTPLSLLIKLKSPTNGSTIKTIEVPDARFTLPGYSGQVQQKLSMSLNFESDAGILNVYKSDSP
jgi:hypothetical protein